MEGYTTEELYRLAKDIYDILPYEENKEMYDSVMVEYNEEENAFPESAIKNILDKLSLIINSNPKASKINDEFLSIIKDDDEGSILEINTIIYINHGQPNEFTSSEEVYVGPSLEEDKYSPEAEEPKPAFDEDEMEAIQA